MSAIPFGMFFSRSLINPKGVNCKLLLRFDGSDGSAIFPDNSGLGHTISKGGTPTISVAQSKFGGASGRFANSGHLLLDGSSDFAFGTGDFTVDFWIRFASTPAGYQLIYDSRAAAGDSRPWIQYTSSMWAAGYGSTTIVSGGSTTVNVWQHIALTRSSSVWRLFVDGVLVNSATNAVNLTNASSRPSIATQGDGIGLGRPDCYIDEMRVVKGTAMWTAGFSPPSIAYT